jgi:hypothetical protein
MDFPTFQAELRRLGGAAHALAAIGAALRLYQTKQEADPAVQALCGRGSGAAGALDGLDRGRF